MSLSLKVIQNQPEKFNYHFKYISLPDSFKLLTFLMKRILIEESGEPEESKDTAR
jgi:hypothetical protein